MNEEHNIIITVGNKDYIFKLSEWEEWNNFMSKFYKSRINDLENNIDR